MNCLKLLISLLFVSISCSALSEEILTPYQYLETTGARELTPFVLHNESYIAVAQLAKDIPNTPANMNGGDADVNVQIYKKHQGKYILYQSLPGHGNESAAFFTIGKKAYLATASVQSGPHVPFNLHSYSMLYQWDGRYFYPIQQFYAYGAKQLYPFNLGSRHFLAQANGVTLPNQTNNADTNSMIFEWNGSQFVPFQKIPSQWGYSFKGFYIDKTFYLAFADHLKQSTLYRWDGKGFVVHQVFPGDGGRAFEAFTIAKKQYLAFANIKSDSIIYQWDGERFVTHQILKGNGGRNFSYFDLNGHHYLFRVNFITGGRTNPKSDLNATLYEWQSDQFVGIQNISTFGAVSSHMFIADGLAYLTLANSLSADLRFKIDSVIYKINDHSFAAPKRASP